MASVVFGIVITSVMFEAAAGGAISIAGPASAPCGAAAFALCCMTARESTTTETTGENKMIHRIFIDTILYSCCGMESYRRQVKAVIPTRGYAALQVIVPASSRNSQIMQSLA